MSEVTESLLQELLEKPITVAIYGGGFKPPTKGHFAVVKKTLEDFPEIDELKIFVGGGVRDGITQEESIKIWEIYKNYLSPKVDIEPSVAPVKSVLGYAKDHPEEKVYWVLGAREGDEDDLKDIESRTRSIEKYPNIEVKVITTSGGVSGTKTRAAIKSGNKEQFFHLIPDVSEEEKNQIWDMVIPVIKEGFMEDIKTKFTKFISAVKQEGKETKEAVSLLIKSAKGDVELSNEQKEQIGNQLKDVLKLIGLTAIAALPGGFIAGALIKLFKAESLITPSAFVNEVGEASAKSYSFTVDTDPSKLIELAKEFHKTNTSNTYYETKLAYRFKTDKANYDVTFAVSMERQRYINLSRDPNFKPGPPYKTYAEVGFNIEGDTEERDTNLNEQFSVLSTVTKIIFDFIDKLNTSGGNLVTLYVGAKSDIDKGSKLDSKRGRLYAAYLKKNLSKLPDYDTREYTNSDGNEFIEIYKKESVNEVGEASLKPYKWEEVDVEGYWVYTRFITDNETQYDVDIKSTMYFPPGQMDSVPALEIEFTAKPKGAEGSSAKIVVNKGEMYRVMSTIVNIIKKYLKKSKAEAIIYSPSKKSDEENFGTQRDNLYRAFISKAFPGTTFKQSGDYITAILPNNAALTLNEADPKKGTGKKPEGSSRRLYTDEDPKDTVGISFKTKEDIVDTLNKTSFKSKSHARQSQIINLIHQRVRAAYGKAKDPEVKARLKRGLDYIEARKEASKEKTERLRKMKEASDPQAGTAIPYGSGFAPVKESDPFGLNELARQVAEEVGRDLTKGWNPQDDFVSLSVFMRDNGMNVTPLPKIKVIKDDKKNASDLLGKTAYYNPQEKSITLYTFGRHPKDVLRSFAHEMVHHEQNLNGTLGNITTTNTSEDGHLDKIEREAYEKGNIMLRNWEDSIKNV